MKRDHDRRKRVGFLKKLIVWGGVILLFLLLAICVVLFVSNIRLSGELSTLKSELEKAGGSDITYDESGVYSLGNVETYDSLKGDQVLPGENAGQKTICLTFDDGPSANTDRILDILAEYDVKATFFVIGKEGEEAEKAYRRIVDEGHTLGMHSYSHKYSEVYASEEAFREDIRRLQEYLYETTGVWPRYYRFPGGSSNTVSTVPVTDLIDYLNDQGIVYYDWNVASGDAVEGGLSAKRIYENCLSGIENNDECVILMHDTSEMNTTVEALPLIIEALKERGDCVFLPIGSETTPVQHVTVQ